MQAVLFDYGLVLTGPPDPAARQRMEQLLHTDSASFHDAYWKYRDDYDRGILTGPTYWTRVDQDLRDQDLRQPLAAATLAALLDADIALWTVPNQPMIDWAARLRSASIRTGILSNIGDAMEDGIRLRLGWMADFDHHTFSHSLGIAKPDPAIYRHAIEGLGVAASRILFLDDRQKNIDAARAAGMAAMLYSNHESFLKELSAANLEGLPLPTA